MNGLKLDLTASINGNYMNSSIMESTYRHDGLSVGTDHMVILC